MGEVLKKIIDIVSTASGIDKTGINENTPIGDSGINSITFIEIVVQIEQAFDIEIDDGDLDILNYNNIGDLLRVVQKNI